MKNWLALILPLILLACSDESKLIDQMTDISNSKWNYDQIPDFPFQIDHTGIYYDFYLKLRISKSYPYENLYLLTHIKGPDGKIATQKVNFTLTDATGKPLGRSSGGTITYELPMLPSYRFNTVGQYTVSLEQNLRDSVVTGIESLGVKIKKGEPIF